MSFQFPSVIEIEQQKQANIKLNKALLKHIRRQNTRKALKNKQIVRFGDELLIAVDRSKKAGLSGGAGTVYPAYLIGPDDKLAEEVMVKVIAGSDAILKDMASPLNEAAYKRIEIETLNGHKVFSSRMSIIPRPKKKKGETVYDIMILMPKVPGTRLDILIMQGRLTKKLLTPEQRIRLAINVLDFYIELHQKGVVHGDVKADNFFIDLETLQVVAIDMAPYYAEIVAAPEVILSKGADITEKSDIYSIAQDLLTPIFSGIRPQIEFDGDLTDRHVIEYGIVENFSTSSRLPCENSVSRTLKTLLRKMRADNPDDRTSLQEAKIILEQALQELTNGAYIEPDENILNQIEQHQKQLQVLKTVLNDPEYRIRPEYTLGQELDQKNIPVKKQSSYGYDFFSNFARREKNSGSVAILGPRM